ncbi:hypothetical protein HK105_204753 [Polyrhizophydium stewartii]|uniref:ABC transporter domain-containing protein n=1 Tax=Polyrhizophydium stewartii TaxID=2732419 RepID=A0ABR4N8E0_9FUNG|nr:GTPase-activating protein [Polyrhizophydium stewartii]
MEPEATVAFVGNSGSGKSTIIQLVERFYDPDRGAIELDGVPLNKLNVAWLRQQIGLVSQEPVLFEGSVADNVALGLIGLPHEHAHAGKKLALIQDACRQANAHDFITRLPQGAIARAIIKNSRILLHDEATSALDTTSERVVQEALDRASKSRTTITIAHRLSTVKSADNIVVMSRGTVVEQGDHGSLVARGGVYARLVEAQHLDTDNKPADSGYNSANSSGTLANDRDLIASSQLDTPIAKPSAADDLEAGSAADKKMSYFVVVRKILALNAPEAKFMAAGLLASIGSGASSPVLAVLFAEVMQTFSEQGAELEHDSK